MNFFMSINKKCLVMLLTSCFIFFFMPKEVNQTLPEVSSVDLEKSLKEVRQHHFVIRVCVESAGQQVTPHFIPTICDFKGLEQ